MPVSMPGQTISGYCTLLLLLLSSLWDRAPKDCTEDKDCSKVLSESQPKSTEQMGQICYSRKTQCHLWGSNLWLPKYITGARKPHTTGQL